MSKTKQSFLNEIIDNSILVQNGANSNKSPDPSFTDWNEFVADESPDPPMIIGGGILPIKSLMVLAGEPKVGKSHLVINLAYHVATGMDWFDFPIETPGKVVIFQAENSYYNQRRRIKMIHKLTEEPYLYPSIPNGQLIVSDAIQGLNLNDSDAYSKIYGILKEIDPVLVIFDPMVNFHNAEENSNTEMASVMESIHRLKEEASVSICLVHHTRKPSINNSGGGVSVRGASAIRGAYDSGLTLTQKFDDDTAEQAYNLDFEIRNGEPIQPLVLELDKSVLTFNRSQKVNNARDFVLNELRSAEDNGMKQVSIVQNGVEIGYSKTMMIRNIQALRSEKKILDDGSKRDKKLFHPDYYNNIPF